MLSDYQLKTVDFYNIPISNFKNLVPNFLIKKYVVHYENLQLYLRLILKLKKMHCELEFNQSQWLKPYAEFNLRKRIEAKKANHNNNKKKTGPKMER